MASSFDLDLSELLAYGVALAHAGSAAPGRAQKVAASSGQALAGEMSARAPRLTGALAGSVTMEVRQSGNAATAIVGPTVDYAGYVNDGTSRQAPQPFLDESLARQAQSFLAGVEGIADEGLI